MECLIELLRIPLSVFCFFIFLPANSVGSQVTILNKYTMLEFLTTEIKHGCENTV